MRMRDSVVGAFKPDFLEKTSDAADLCAAPLTRCSSHTTPPCPPLMQRASLAGALSGAAIRHQESNSSRMSLRKDVV